MTLVRIGRETTSENAGRSILEYTSAAALAVEAVLDLLPEDVRESYQGTGEDLNTRLALLAHLNKKAKGAKPTGQRLKLGQELASELGPYIRGVKAALAEERCRVADELRRRVGA